LATDLLGVPPDDIELAIPKTILKTSSGKIRRAANRELYERGQIAQRHRPPWLQMVHIMLTGLMPAIRRVRRIVSEALYASYVWLLFVFFAPWVWLSVMLLPSPSWRWAFVRGAGRLLAKACCMPLAVRGLENLRQQKLCVLVSNHASYIDSFVLAAALPHDLSFVAKAELAQRASLRCPLQRLGTEFVDRLDKQKGIEDAMRLGQKVRAGQALMVFPEGTFSRMPGLLPFHMGAFVAAVEGCAPVIPVAIRGTRSILRDNSWFPRRGAITITIGPAIEASATSAEGETDAWAKALRLRDATRKHILQYCGEPDLQHEKSPI
jgi:1-acyl-sn-glycerol-3-phosphate acyltransferase